MLSFSYSEIKDDGKTRSEEKIMTNGKKGFMEVITEINGKKKVNYKTLSSRNIKKLLMHPYEPKSLIKRLQRDFQTKKRKRKK